MFRAARDIATTCCVGIILNGVCWCCKRLKRVVAPVRPSDVDLVVVLPPKTEAFADDDDKTRVRGL
jgi:hypothetical protein